MMPATPTLILLPGWAMAPTSLTALSDELKARLPGWTISCAALPALTDDALDAWLDELDDRLPDHAWLAGWSLGGMLALALADRRRERCPGVITLGSNLSFVTRRDWPCALPPATLAAFQSRWASAPGKTRSRFFALTARGSAASSTMVRQLEAHAAPMSIEQALAGLSLLAHIDLQALPALDHCPRLHLLAELDALVPAHADEAILERHPEHATACQLAGTGHAFVMEHPAECARHMATFIQQCRTGDPHDH